MASNSVKAKCSDAYANAEPSSVINHFEGVETRRRPSKCSDAYDEGIVQGVVKATQTRILWSTVQVCHALPLAKYDFKSIHNFIFYDSYVTLYINLIIFPDLKRAYQ